MGQLEPTETQRRLGRPRGAAMAGSLAIAAMLLAIAIYAYYAPLAKGIIATGQVVVAGERKVVQHRTGGIVAEILVEDGQRVDQGTLLVRLEDLEPRRQLLKLIKQRDELLARAAMSSALAGGGRRASYGAAILQRLEDEHVRALVDNHDRALAAKWERIDSQLRVHAESIAALESRIQGVHQRMESVAAETRLTRQLLQRQQELVDRQLAGDSQMQSLRLQLVRLEGQSSNLASELETARREIVLERSRADQLPADIADEARSEYAAVVNERAIVEDEIAIQRDILAQTRIVSPRAGVVFNQQVHTIGAVVSAGQPLMEIVPEDELLVRALVQQTDIDNVSVGQSARVRFSAFPQDTDEIAGTVVELSADAMQNDDGTLVSYVAHIDLDPQGLAGLAPRAVVPGMPAEVFFEGDHRTALDYFSGTLGALWRAAFTEE